MTHNDLAKKGGKAMAMWAVLVRSLYTAQADKWTLNRRQKLAGTSVLAVFSIGCAVFVGCLPSRAPEGYVRNITDRDAGCGPEYFSGESRPHYFKLKQDIQSALDAKEAAGEDRLMEQGEILRLLPESYRRGFFLVYKSRSVQKASFKKPRLIFTGDPARPTLMVAAAGAVGDATPKPGLEIIEYSEKSKQFCFRSIKLRPNKEPKFEDNPTLCRSCHEINMRPLWEPYNTWVGVYGSRDGVMDQNSDEYAGFKQFHEESRHQPPYDAIVGPAYFGRVGEHDLVEFINELKDDELMAPLGVLTTGLNELNFGRLNHLLQSTKLHNRYRFAILGSFLGCSDIDKFLPTDLAANHPTSFSDIRKATRDDLLAANKKLDDAVTQDNMPADDRTSSGLLDTSVSDYLRTMTSLRYLIENRETGAVGLRDWSMSRHNSYAFATDSIGITNLGYVYSQTAFSDEPELAKALNQKELYSTYERENLPADTIAKHCETIKNHSLALGGEGPLAEQEEEGDSAGDSTNSTNGQN